MLYNIIHPSFSNTPRSTLFSTYPTLCLFFLSPWRPTSVANILWECGLPVNQSPHQVLHLEITVSPFHGSQTIANSSRARSSIVFPDPLSVLGVGLLRAYTGLVQYMCSHMRSQLLSDMCSRMQPTYWVICAAWYCHDYWVHMCSCMPSWLLSSHVQPRAVPIAEFICSVTRVPTAVSWSEQLPYCVRDNAYF